MKVLIVAMDPGAVGDAGLRVGSQSKGLEHLGIKRFFFFDDDTCGFWF